MIKNYFKTTLRSLFKNKAFSFLNIAGLTIGVTCASLILLWVQDELTFNHNFKKRANVYTIYENQTYEGKTSTFKATPGPMAKAIKTEIPGIKNAARMTGESGQVFAVGEKIITEQGRWADPEIFSMLQLPFVSGNPAGGFPGLHSIVINETMAKKFFGKDNAVGKNIRMNNEQDFTVSGVFKDLPKNSSFRFQWLAPLENREHQQSWTGTWGANWARSYVETDPSANINAINKKLAGYIGSKQTGNNTVSFLFAMNDWNLRDNFTEGKMTGGRIVYVRLFSLIAFVILIIACINFMNLSTARSGQRAKEVGVRKVMGAAKSSLVGQFIGESLLLSLLSVVLAVALMTLLLPYFNRLVEKDLSINMFTVTHLLYLLTITLVTGLLAGSYPAFYLSSFNPVSVLKNLQIKGSAIAGLVRQGLVVVQFTASIILIIGTVAIYQQIQHVKNRGLGYNKNNLVYINLQGNQADHFTSLYKDLQQTGVVDNAALSDYPILQIWNNTDNYSWQGKDPSKNPLVTWENVSPQFIETMGIQLISGRNFYSDAALDSNSVMINEALAKQMGKEGRIGGIIRDGSKRPFQVAGIVKDFLYNDMYISGAPLLLYSHPAGTACLSIRVKSNTKLQQALQKIGAVMKADNPAYPFDYQFIDDDFTQLFKTETLTGNLAGVFAALAIFISCLGLFGLAAYTAERRIKEIGIRKILGASVFGLAGLLSVEFLKLVLLSCLLAFAAAFWWVNQWLQNYAYRITLHWSVFVVAGMGALLIALSTVSFQAIKSALANPVKSLRSE